MSFLKKIYKYKKKTALILDDGSKITYEKLINETEFIKKFIKKRSLVIILAGNNLESIISYVALINFKSVVIMLDQKLDHNYLKKIIYSYKPDFVFAPKNYLFNNNFNKYFTLYNYQIYKNKKNIQKKLSNDRAVLLTTSGSTGTKKFVRQSYKNYENNSKDIIKSLNINSSSTVITTLPISYTYGLSVINTHLLSGAKIILNEKSIISREFWKLYQIHRPSYFYGVPYIFKILAKMKFKNFFSSKLTVAACAGGELSSVDYLNLIKKMEEHNKLFFYMYGQTEATARMSVLNSKFSSTRHKSIGKPIGQGRFELRDNKNKIINKNNVSGNLYYKGKNVCLGYSKLLKDLSKKNENNYILNTGDIAKFDNDGFFYIVGRKKRIIKIFGHRINMDDIEKIILNMGYEVNCINKDDKILINYKNKGLNIAICSAKISDTLKVNINYIEFFLVENLKKNNKIL